jgi:ankyrin repeat protein
MFNAPAGQYDGFTALQAAAGGGHLEVVERLLAAGADVNAPAGQYNGFTALQGAAEGWHIEVAERLLEAGAERVFWRGTRRS